MKNRILLAAVILVLVSYVIVFGRKSRLVQVRNLRAWLTGDGLKTIGYLVPLFYTVTIVYFFNLFDYSCAAKNLSSTHHSICRLLYLLPISSMALCVFSNPGYITRANHADALRTFNYDRILYMPNVSCRTCHFVKPARSKHCGVCDRCIEMNDHHCIFINNCVGRNNYRYFIYFLVAHLFVFSYGLWLLIPMALKGWSTSLSSSWRSKIWQIYRTNSEPVCLAVLCALLFWITAIFTAYTLYFVYLGVTTNEQEKWDDVKDLIEDGDLYTYKLPEGVHAGSIVLQKLPDGTYNRNLTTHEEALVNQNDAVITQVKGFQDLNNMYDKGFWNNFKLLLFPNALELSKKAC